MTRRVPGDVLVHLRRARDHIDRHFAEDLGLDELAAIARLSKFHFLRFFASVYGPTPLAYLEERRVERAQDLLRTTNLTVTEVCHAVGYSSLGSFSSRFREIVGETPAPFRPGMPCAAPRAFPAAGSSWPASWRSALTRERERTAYPAIREKHALSCRHTFEHMITNVSLVSVWVKDLDESLAFYTDVLGFAAGDDIVLGEDFRWVTVTHPSQPELSLHLTTPSKPLSDELITAMHRAQSEGGLPGVGLHVDDCRKTVEALKAKGVEFLQEPEDRPYGVEALMRDNSGNWMVLVEPREYTPEDFEGISFE